MDFCELPVIEFPVSVHDSIISDCLEAMSKLLKLPKMNFEILEGSSYNILSIQILWSNDIAVLDTGLRAKIDGFIIGWMAEDGHSCKIYSDLSEYIKNRSKNGKYV